jgi:hypothetical protein
LSFETDFPASVRGPQLLAAFRRLASSLAAETTMGFDSSLNGRASQQK